MLASETARYRLTDADVDEVALSVASYLIVHPRGALVWDAGAVADRERAGEGGFEQCLTRRDGQERFVKIAYSLTSQLAAAGYAPGDVTHLALSHYHWDHTADANLFANAEWLVAQAEHDVFGDGTDVIRQAAGHTEGHAVLYVKLANTGGIVLSGDLYHYPAERTLDRLPTFEVSEVHTKAAREKLEGFLSRTGAALWIQHDLVAHRKLKKSPQYYD